MSISIGHCTLALFALAAVSTAANSQVPQPPVSNPLDGGRVYQVVLHTGVTWDVARAAAETMTHEGVQGRLATSNTTVENQFLHDLIANNFGHQFWLGGFQEPNVNCEPSPPGQPVGEPRCGWKWINGEAIDPDNNTGLNFTFWAPGEPNNRPSGEHHLTIGRFPAPGWNDEGSALHLMRGYVVEFGDRLAPFPSTDCAATTDGCPVPVGDVDVTVLKLPASAVIPEGDTTTVRTWLINVDPERCKPGVDAAPLPLDLLADPGFEAIVPGWLCTHPDNPQFLVFKTSSAVQIPSGVVAITNDTTALLNPAYDCNAPIGPSPETALGQDVVVFQYDDDEDMIEFGTTTGVAPVFDDGGSVTESTNACINPSRGSGGKGSYIFVGLSIHQGSAVSAHERLVDLVEHKLRLLGVTVQRARNEGAIKSGDFNKLSSAVNAAVNHLQRGNFGEALVHMQKFQATTKSAVFKTVPSGTNWNGEFLMRIDNSVFTHKVKVMLLAP